MSAPLYCSTCGTEATPSLSIRHKECGHLTHAECFGPNGNFKKCNTCIHGNNSVQKELVSSSYTSSFSSSSLGGGGGGEGMRKNIQEPHLTDGIDYVNNPGTKKSGPGVLHLVKSVISVNKKKSPEEEKPSPEQVLRMRVPIQEIFGKHQYGLDHMLRDGITIDDFLVNGYTLDDLIQFEYLNGKKPKKCLDTFTYGLGLTANHLRDYPDELPIETFKKVTNIHPEEFCTRLGLEFPEDSGLVCFGDDRWNAMDMVRFGIDMDTLINDMGLYAVEQYVDLMSNVPSRLREQAETGLKVDMDKHGKKLVNLTQIAEEEARLEQERMEQEERLEQLRIAEEEREQEAIDAQLWEEQEAQRREELERERLYLERQQLSRMLSKSKNRNGPRAAPIQEEEETYYFLSSSSSSEEEEKPVQRCIKNKIAKKVEPEPEWFDSSSSSSSSSFEEEEEEPEKEKKLTSIKQNIIKPKKRFNMPKQQVKSQLQIEKATEREKALKSRKERMNRIGFLG